LHCPTPFAAAMIAFGVSGSGPTVADHGQIGFE
jgi:hypothetical protein